MRKGSIFAKRKLKYSITDLEVETSRIVRQMTSEGGKIVSPAYRSNLPSGTYSW